ncbi:YhgE/Pip domain-containing protein [Paramicrobacterium fandaimingii]|uniref:YhgE/Pip domain-containing protein n=1 Tax=Paramicrobacterium fandaimingii TaxID=2708079 RepID=UPI00141DBA71|nr:YhgE/Pip domain-containing protein [Microbacterium fandaimingii]
MKIFAMLRAEFARLTATTMAKLALLALMVVPLLYGGLYLWANQDPYDNLDQVPVALVVDDEGTMSDGEYTNYGDEVAESLLDDGTFSWSRVSRSSAEHGVASGDFDFSVTIPAAFSESLVSPQTDKPRQAEVVLTTNDANSYLASTIGESAITTIKEQIVSMVNEQAASRMLDSIAEIRVSLVSAADGAGKLADGAETAYDGSSDLADGLAKLATGATSLSDGLDELKSKTQALPGQTETLADGAAQVAAGNQKIADTADSVAAASESFNSALPGVRTDISTWLQEQGYDDGQIADVLKKLDPLRTKADAVNSTVQGTVSSIDDLSNGAWQVSNGARTLADAMPALTAGISDAATGAQQLEDGASTASEGAVSLRDGLSSLLGGITELRDGLQDGVDSIPNSSQELRDDQAATIADPVDVSTSAVTKAGTYGAGLAPFFVALAAWIGIYALFLIIKPVSKRAITAMRAPIRTTLAGWMMPAGLGAIQMIALYFIVSGALGFTVHQPWGAFGIMALSSMTFAAIILALNVWFGSVGQFLGLVLMVVQLVTAGGTFPWQTLPEPLRALHFAFPMPYTVDALRQFMYGGSYAAAGEDAIVLGLWLVGALALTTLGVARMTRFRTMRDLQPSLIG